MADDEPRVGGEEVGDVDAEGRGDRGQRRDVEVAIDDELLVLGEDVHVDRVEPVGRAFGGAQEDAGHFCANW